MPGLLLRRCVWMPLLVAGCTAIHPPEPEYLDFNDLWTAQGSACAGDRTRFVLLIKQEARELVATHVTKTACADAGDVVWRGKLPSGHVRAAALPVSFDVALAFGDPADGRVTLTTADRMLLEAGDRSLSMTRGAEGLERMGSAGAKATTRAAADGGERGRSAESGAGAGGSAGSVALVTAGMSEPAAASGRGGQTAGATAQASGGATSVAAGNGGAGRAGGGGAAGQSSVPAAGSGGVRGAGTGGEAIGSVDPWVCEQKAESCACRRQDTGPRVACSSTPPCCFLSIGGGIASCECWPEDSEACRKAMQPNSGVYQLPSCPPE